MLFSLIFRSITFDFEDIMYIKTDMYTKHMEKDFIDKNFMALS